ncbi:hypothetical protein BURK2_03262 [Burkholderiales bacterium]|nr:hypothetical protein BURK2_03262 [Burkholderiales bacterium]
MIDTASYLETYIVPVCRFDQSSGTALIRDFFGTAFFVGTDGVFLTARHVLDDGTSAVEESAGFLGLCVRPPGAGGNVACPITSMEAAEPPFDVSVGTVEASFPSRLTVADVSVNVWREVASYGYPCTAQNRSNEEFWMYGRGFRGYVHREVRVGQLPGNPHPHAFETSFSMPQGLSGGPLFVAASPNDVVIGVCVGINRGETTEYMFEERQANGQTLTETRVRVEEYGIAHDLRRLLNWQPSNLGGRSLAEVVGR